MHHPTDRIAHTTAFDTPVVEHWLEQEIASSLLQQHRNHNIGMSSLRCLDVSRDLPVVIFCHCGYVTCCLNRFYTLVAHAVIHKERVFHIF